MYLVGDKAIFTDVQGDQHHVIVTDINDNNPKEPIYSVQGITANEFYALDEDLVYIAEE